MKLSTENKELVGLLSLGLILLLLGVYSSSIVGFLAKGFDTQAVINQFNIYTILALAGLIGILLAWGIERVIKQGDSKYGSSVLFSSQGEIPALSFFKRFTGLQIFVLSLIVSFIIGLFSINIRNQSFTGVTFIQQQFTETASVIFTGFLVPIAENLAFAAILALAIVGLRAIARNKNWTSGNFKGLVYLFIPILGGLVGIANHLLRYSTSDLSLTTIFMFWFLGAFITILIGSFIPFWVIHLTNNLLVDLKRFFSNDTIFLTIIFILIGLILIYVLFLRKIKKKEDNV